MTDQSLALHTKHLSRDIMIVIESWDIVIQKGHWYRIASRDIMVLISRTLKLWMRVGISRLRVGISWL